MKKETKTRTNLKSVCVLIRGENKNEEKSVKELSVFLKCNNNALHELVCQRKEKIENKIGKRKREKDGEGGRERERKGERNKSE